MPTLQIHTSTALSAPQAAHLAQTLSVLTQALLGKRADLTAVLLQTIPSTHWYIDSLPAPLPTAFLEITITQGTNTEAEKAAFIAAAFRTLQEQLGKDGVLAPVSYVLVRELPATDWGYGGETQAARRQRSTPNPPEA